MEIGKESEAARRVLEYWREQLWPGLRGSLDAPEGAVVVLARLAEGFTERGFSALMLRV